MKIIIKIININDAEPCYRCDSFIKYMSAGTLSYYILYLYWHDFCKKFATIVQLLLFTK